MARCSLLSLLAIPAVLGLLVPACTADNILSDDTLFRGQSLSYGSYFLTMQTDCNLVLHDTDRAIWASGTNGRGSNCRATMQNDGNFVVYTGSGDAVWASNTNRDIANYVLILQKDRNLVIYGPAIWATGTNVEGTVGVVVASNNTAVTFPAVVNQVSGDDLLGSKLSMAPTTN